MWTIKLTEKINDILYKGVYLDSDKEFLWNNQTSENKSAQILRKGDIIEVDFEAVKEQIISDGTYILNGSWMNFYKNKVNPLITLCVTEIIKV